MRKLVKKYLITLSVAGFILLSNLFPVVCSDNSLSFISKAGDVACCNEIPTTLDDDEDIEIIKPKF